MITGANGFIGKNVLPLLLNAGYEVHAVSTKAIESGAVEWHRLNLFDAQSINRLLKDIKPDYLLHLAWDTTPGKYLGTPQNLGWVAASLNLCKAFFDSGGRRAVFAGTCFEYDLYEGVLSEDSCCAPSSLYGTCKLSLSNIINKYCFEQQLSFAWGRIFYLFGPHENKNRVIPYVIKSLLAGKEALCSDGLAKKDYLYVEDIARAFVHLLGIEQNGNFNIGSGKAVPLRDILKIAAEYTGRPELLKLGAQASRSEPPLIEADISKLNKTGFIPEYSLNDGIEKTIDWWNAQPM